MDKIGKALQKFSDKEKKNIQDILSRIKNNKLANLDIKKLKGYNDIFRIRKGQFRIIFRTNNDSIKILAIEKRNDSTYNF